MEFSKVSGSLAAILLFCVVASSANHLSGSALAQVISCPANNNMYCCGITCHLSSPGAQALATLIGVDVSSAGDHVGVDCIAPSSDGCLHKPPICCSGALATANALSTGGNSINAWAYVTHCTPPRQN